MNISSHQPTPNTLKSLSRKSSSGDFSTAPPHSFVQDQFVSSAIEGGTLCTRWDNDDRSAMEPSKAKLSVEGRFMNTRFALDVFTGEAEDQHHTHSSQAYFNGFPREALPSEGGLREGVTYRGDGNSTMTYQNGTLVLHQESKHFNGSCFWNREVEMRDVTVEIETSPDMSDIGEIRFKDVSREKLLFGGYGAPKTLTDLSINNFTSVS